MDKKGKIALIAALVLVAILVVSLVVAAPRAKKACSDGNDNDGDGYIDLNDPGCANKNDDSELDPNVECDDGVDNDGDNAIDYNDGGCSGPTDTDESNCGDDVCEGEEDCDSCPADCLGAGEVCCDGVAYTGDCCDNNDCTLPATCVDYYCTIADSCSKTEGWNPEIQGTASGYLDEIYYEDTDYCINSTYVMEYYCMGDYEYYAPWNCAINITNSSCSNGACI